MLKRLPIKVRLTLWYVLIVGIIFFLISGYLILRFERTLISSIDSVLESTAAQAFTNLDDENGFPAFQLSDKFNSSAMQLNLSNFALRLILPNGKIIDRLGTSEFEAAWGALQAGFTTTSAPDDDEQWRVYTAPVLDNHGNLIAWLQVTQTLELMYDTIQNLRDQLLFGIPILLILTGLGGYFLATRALRPIEAITNTAQTIEAGDLSQRINYAGPDDEIGQLATTFDAMLERLQLAFYRERRFTGDAAHELRSPLGVLKGQIEVTLSRQRKPAEYEKTLHLLQEHVERLIRLSNGLLFLASFDQQKTDWQPSILDISVFLQDLVKQFVPLGQNKRIEIETEIHAGLEIHGDADQIMQLFIMGSHEDLILSWSFWYTD